MNGVNGQMATSLLFLTLTIYFLEFADDVNAQPTLSMTLEGQPVTDGQDVLLTGGEDYTFQCVHSESADIMWLLGTTPKAAGSDNQLTLRNVFLECGLELKCFSGDNGDLFVSVIIKVIVAPDELVISEQYQGTIENGERAIICQDKDYTFKCLANSINPEADFRWYIDGNIKHTTLATSDETGCSLLDSMDEFTFRGNYESHQDKILQCKASNEADPMGKTVEVILDVTVHPESVSISKDGFKIPDGDKLQITAEEETTVRCTVTRARPAASIEWFLDGANKTGLATQTSTNDGGVEDTTSDLSLTFGANYCDKNLKCVGLHPETHTEIETSVTLDILVPPGKPTISFVGGNTFADGDTVSITQNETYVFKCSSEGAIPAVDFQWLLGTDVEDTYISPSEVTNCIPTQGSFTYTLTADHVKHHIEYIKCLVKNEANTDGVSSRVKLVVDALFGFQNTRLTISESEPEVVVTLFRIGPLDVTTSARLSVSQRSSATAGVDYRSATLLPVTVEFERGKDTLDVAFLLENDEEFELSETLILELDMARNGKIIAGRDMVVISINDSGGVPKCTSSETGKYTGCKDLDTLSKFPVSDDNVEMVADTLADLTEGIPTGKATPGDVNSLARTLENVVDVQNGAMEVTSSCVAAVDNLINGLKPAPRNESDEGTNMNSDGITNSTSTIVQSLQKQVTLTLRKEGSVRIIEPNVACEGVIAIDPDMGIGIVILKDNDDIDEGLTTDATIVTDGITTGGQTTGTIGSTTVTEGDGLLVSSTAAPGRAEDVQFTNETVIVINELDEVSEDTTGILYIPPDFIRRPMNDDTNETEVVFICYANPALFPPDDDDEFIDSIIISATVDNEDPTRPEPTTPGSIIVTDASVSNATNTAVPDESLIPREPVIIEVATTEKVTKQEARCIKESHPVVHHCVFWDFELNYGKGGWSPEGCWVNRTANNEVTCYCDHLTNFAVLASYKEFQHEVLDWISEIGCYVSIGALGITLLIFVLFKEPRKVLASKAPRQVLFQYCISLLLLYVTFLVFIDRSCPVLYCEVGAILLHYFTLSSMMWMAVQSRYLYHKLVSVLYMDYTWFIYTATIISWGVPLIPIVPTIFLYYESYQNDNYCFLVPGWVLYFGLLLPIALIMLHNFVSFVIILSRLCRRKLPNSTDAERVHYKRQFQNGFAMTMLMGLTWASAFLAIDYYSSFIFSIIFCVFNSLQGLFVFLLFCLRQPDVRSLCTCCKVKHTTRQRSYEADWEPSHYNPSYSH